MDEIKSKNQTISEMLRVVKEVFVEILKKASMAAAGDRQNLLDQLAQIIELSEAGEKSMDEAIKCLIKK